MLALLVTAWTIESLLILPHIEDPQMRPSGDMYAYVRQGRVVAAALDGTAPREVHRGRRPRWSPDSRRMAFVAPQEGTDQIFIYDAGSGDIGQFTHSPSPVGAYSWAADSRVIAYLAPDAGPAQDPLVAGEYSHYSRLYWQGMGAGPARQITSGPSHVASFALSPFEYDHLLGLAGPLAPKATEWQCRSRTNWAVEQPISAVYGTLRVTLIH
jgi:hypothetical protein